MSDGVGVIAAERAIEAHKQAMGIEGNEKTQAWHLVLSLREYCFSNSISFDELIRDTERHIHEFPEDFPEMSVR